MKRFERLKVKFKVRLPVWILALFTFCMAGYSLYVVQTSLKEAHIGKVKSFVASARSIAQENYSLVQEGMLSESYAKRKTRDAIRAMRFDNGSRVFVFDEQGIRVVSNEIYDEGTSAWESRQTQSMIRHALNGGGLTYYNGARVVDGQEFHSLPKVAWSQHFAPWGWVIASAVYLDDVTAAFWANLVKLAFFLGIGGTIVYLVADAMIHSIAEPLSSLTDTMKKLAEGDTDVEIDGVNRGDEIGEMAAAMQTFVAHETQRLEMQDQLRDLAFTDSLTGLANRSIFYDHLRNQIRDGLNNHQLCALMILDLDRFKTINDTHGHLAGDTVLVEVADRLFALLGERAFIGRLSGDEFFLILSGLSDCGEAEELANQIVSRIEEPINLEGNPVYVSTSVGLAFGPRDSLCESKLYRFADMALYEAKQEGGSRVQRYTPEMGVKAQQRYEMEALIKSGLHSEQFVAHFQGKVDLKTQKLIGAEALCRWYHPKHGMISPAEFIPVAEETGMINDIGYLMLKQSCAFAVESNQHADEPFVVAVNVSAKQLLYGRFLATLGKCLEETGCRAEWLELEITESLLLNDSDNIVEMLDTIARMGISIAIDDFGTGYSAMSYLSRFPITCLKVDQSFVRGMCSDSQKHVLVSAILAMANGLGLKTVAEGVEDEKIASALIDLNCDCGQGYLWHKPSPADQLLARLKSERAA